MKKQDTDGRLNAAICCAPALALGTWGLLEGKKVSHKRSSLKERYYYLVFSSFFNKFGLHGGFLQATCYPVFMEKLAATCDTASESRVEIDGRIVTSRGPGTTIEFSLTLIEKLCGKQTAKDVSSILVCFCLCPLYQKHSN